VWAMAEEERFTRVKHAIRTYPRNAARFCLDWAGIQPDDLDVIAIGWDLPRLLPRFGGQWDFTTPREFLSRRLGWSFAGRGGPELVCVPHHRAHAVSAFYASGLESAAVVVNDGNGEDESIPIWEARFGAPVVPREVWPRSHSLGFMYDAACRAVGLTFLEAGKTMDLAAYGKAKIDNTLAADGGRRHGISPSVHTGSGSGLRRHHSCLGGAPRPPRVDPRQHAQRQPRYG
jgi:carbamoyltransferase